MERRPSVHYVSVVSLFACGRKFHEKPEGINRISLHRGCSFFHFCWHISYSPPVRLVFTMTTRENAYIQDPSVATKCTNYLKVMRLRMLLVVGENKYRDKTLKYHRPRSLAWWYHTTTHLFTLLYGSLQKYTSFKISGKHINNHFYHYTRSNRERWP